MCILVYIYIYITHYIPIDLSRSLMIRYALLNDCPVACHYACCCRGQCFRVS